MKTFKEFITERYYDEEYDDDYEEQNHEYEFAYSCVGANDIDELNYIIDHMKPISMNLFLRHVSIQQINECLMYDIRYTKETLKKDWSVSYYRIKTLNLDAYIFKNSAIEYVFKKS